MSQLGGKHAYQDRLGKSRTPWQSRHFVTRNKPSPPEAGRQLLPQAGDQFRLVLSVGGAISPLKFQGSPDLRPPISKLNLVSAREHRTVWRHTDGGRLG